jgi:hypothetical protein
MLTYVTAVSLKNGLRQHACQRVFVLHVSMQTDMHVTIIDMHIMVTMNMRVFVV